MPYRVFYHPDVRKEDISNIPKNMKKRIREAIKQRLLNEPAKYGSPLKRSLRGYRKLRVGDYRVIYRVDKENVIVLKIGDRREVYSKIHLRMKN
ncbi:MAG: type II toxin-antitoxin system RelE/ParE family toxin [Candidatus Omnitrophica bacterium]|nr:type II toxin-antitoxin system RelE/ParE family toxin [Candidatus Omnitrophota bacterium]